MTTFAPDVAAPAPPTVPAVAPPPGRFGLSHIPALDGLRGLAVAAVLAYHGGYLNGGYLGVDLFFVLSGFLITSLLLAEKAADGRIDLVRFWVRRIRRLFPALIGLLVGVGFFAVFWARPVDLGGIRSDGLATLAYVANWHTILQGSSYWDISLAPSPLQHTWSLAIEEQFYLLWPIIVSVVLSRAGRRRGPKVLFQLSVVLAVVSCWLFVALHAFGASDTRVYEGTDTRGFALLLGAALAAWLRCKPTAPEADGSRVEALALGAALLLGIAWVRLGGADPLLYWGGLPVCSFLALVVVRGAINPTSPILGRVCSLAPLRALGLISYGLYLWHWPIYQVLTPVRVGLEGPALFVLRVAASLAVACLSFVFVERPIRTGALRGRQGRVAIPIALTAAVAVLLIATVGAVAPGDVNVAAARQRPTRTVVGAPTVLYVGDSVAVSMSEPVIEAPTKFGVNAVDGGVIGCNLIYEGHQVKGEAGDITRPSPCSQTYPDLLRRFQPDVVFMLFGVIPNAQIRLGDRWVSACDGPYRTEYERTLERAVTTLGSGGATVVLATTPKSTNGFRSSRSDEHTRCVNRWVKEVAGRNSHAVLLDLNAHLCPREKCMESYQGAQVRPDSLHFSGPGAEPTVRWVVERTLALGRVKRR